jgi:hypothetical protein
MSSADLNRYSSSRDTVINYKASSFDVTIHELEHKPLEGVHSEP